MLWVADCCMRVLPAVHERCLLAQLHVVECDLRNATGGSRVEKMWPTSYETGRDYAETRELAPPLLYTRFNLLATPLFSLPPLPLHYPSVSLRSLASLCTFHASLPSWSLFCPSVSLSTLHGRHMQAPTTRDLDKAAAMQESHREELEDRDTELASLRAALQALTGATP
mmetsp:Transcript_66132/g.144471  ORF Transcript_66132/g.144471 Transcript_66132/m.144471 type:complete len:169 (+) Transcript_66132:331-837(+)